MINKLLSRRGLLVIGLTAYLLFAISSFPATLAVAWFAPDDIKTSNVSGTAWSGRAQTIATPDVTLVDTTWNARPLSLLTAKLSYRLKAKVFGGAIETIASISSNGTIRLTNLGGVLPINALPPVVPAVTIDGRLGLDIEELLIEDQWPIDARGTVDIVDLNIVSPVAQALGSFQVVFTGAGETALEGQISEIDSPLVASGVLSLPSDRQWQVAGTACPTPAASAQLSQGLAFLGSPTPDGCFSLSYPTR